MIPMRIKMLVSMATAHSSPGPGEEIVVADEEGAHYVEIGYAELVDADEQPEETPADEAPADVPVDEDDVVTVTADDESEDGSVIASDALTGDVATDDAEPPVGDDSERKEEPVTETATKTPPATTAAKPKPKPRTPAKPKGASK